MHRNEASIVAGVERPVPGKGRANPGKDVALVPLICRSKRNR